MTSPGVFGTRQAVDWGQFFYEQSLSRSVSCLHLRHMRVEENSTVHIDVSFVMFVEGWKLYCGYIVRELDFFRKVKNTSKVSRVAV